jgi:hypothetical protein
VYKQLEGRENLREGIITALLRCAGKEELIEKRVAAVKCLSTSILPYTGIFSSMSQTVE